MPQDESVDNKLAAAFLHEGDTVRNRRKLKSIARVTIILCVKHNTYKHMYFNLEAKLKIAVAKPKALESEVSAF